ncbi:hypothetical protein [Endozoicomonas sp.]|uniref:hypothetical protein n=1 Tax=Endozoicomonas sp. TaxID=1892382 RepID=UPI003AF4429A
MGLVALVEVLQALLLQQPLVDLVLQVQRLRPLVDLVLLRLLADFLLVNHLLLLLAS